MTERAGIADIFDLPDSALPVTRIVVASIDGSTPREPGAAMFVTEAETAGTIGGGQLEFEAIAHARAMLKGASANPQRWLRELRAWPLGPSLGQCCGGAVRILFEIYGHEECDVLKADGPALETANLILRPVEASEPLRLLAARQQARGLPLPVARAASDMLGGVRALQATLLPARTGTCAYFIEPMGTLHQPLFIYGAGHVGRAIVKAITDLDFEVHWADVHSDRFPAPLPDHVKPIFAQDLAVIAQGAPEGAYHLVLTYSHALDLAICHALLASNSFGFLGLIGSKSKRARFLKRLREGGVSQAALARLTCPIGIGALRGKAPATIAISVAAQLIEQIERDRDRGVKHRERKVDEAGRISA